MLHDRFYCCCFHHHNVLDRCAAAALFKVHVDYKKGMKQIRKAGEEEKVARELQEEVLERVEKAQEWGAAIGRKTVEGDR